MIDRPPGGVLKRHHLFAYSCTLLLPVGALLGAGAGSALGLPIALTILGSASAVAASWALVRTAGIRRGA